MNNKKKRILMFMILCIMLLIITGSFLILRNSVRLEAKTDYLPKQNIILYRQDDERWAQDQLGESRYTMKSSGCLVSCIAMAVTMSGMEITPGELNELFSVSSVYDGEGNLQWEEVKKLDGYIVEGYFEPSNEKIEEYLSKGIYPIARVRMMGIGNFHYVLIIGSEEGEYLCLDPLQDEVTKLSEYGNRAYSFRCVWYEKPEDISLYESYLAANYADSEYVYSYFDCDNDGKLELLLKQRDADRIASNIMKQEGSGLRDIYTKEYKDFSVKELDWVEIPSGERTEDEQQGIDVTVKEEGNWNWTIKWYLDEESFLKDFGFAGKDPFYQYTDRNNDLVMSLFYDEQAQKGCGIMYLKNRTDYGFVFSQVHEEEWEGVKDYYKLESVYGDGDTGEKSIDKNYQEYYEYDEEGKLIHCKSTGTVEWYSDEPEQWTILEFDYKYDDKGKLKQRSYSHHPNIFGTWYTTGESCFDELGRVEYESNYITHGRQENFYIYSDDNEKPAYRLMVDPGWDAEFIKYT